MSRASDYIAILVALIGDIPIDSGTLASKGLLYEYDKWTVDKSTEIHIFRDLLVSEMFENNRNKRTHRIIIRVVTKAVRKQEGAQELIYNLEEAILGKAEQNPLDGDWYFLDNREITPNAKLFTGNYFVKEINLEIQEIVNV